MTFGVPFVRRFGLVNGRGVAALYLREMRRELKILGIALGAPVIRALLFVGVFALALGRGGAQMGGMSFIEFLIPGLIAVSVLERAFEAGAFSIVYDKTEGIFADMAMVPLTPGEIVVGYAAAGASGALFTGVVVWAALLPFGGGLPAAPLALAFFVVAGALMVNLFSLIAGLWARRWDNISAVETFLFTPFLFLSGVFYALAELPGPLQPLARANPLFYVVDGVRYGLTGQGEADPLVAAAVCLGVVAVMGAVLLRLFAVGYRLKS